MGHKIATCNYCGTRAAMVPDRSRHELACSSCGAPLHEIKAMPRSQPERPRAKGRPMTLPRQDHDSGRAAPPPRKRAKKRRKGIGRRMFEEIWDVVEDVFD